MNPTLPRYITTTSYKYLTVNISSASMLEGEELEAFECFNAETLALLEPFEALKEESDDWHSLPQCSIVLHKAYAPALLHLQRPMLKLLSKLTEPHILINLRFTNSANVLTPRHYTAVLRMQTLREADKAFGGLNRVRAFFKSDVDFVMHYHMHHFCKAEQNEYVGPNTSGYRSDEFKFEREPVGLTNAVYEMLAAHLRDWGTEDFSTRAEYTFTAENS